MYNFNFTETLTRAHGRITEEHVDRVSKLSGPMGDALDSMFARQMGSTYVQHGKSTKLTQKEQVKTMVNQYKEDKLLACIPGRSHKSFQNFSMKVEITNPTKFKETLFKHCYRIDFIGQRMPTYEEIPNPQYVQMLEQESLDTNDNYDTETHTDNEMDIDIESEHDTASGPGYVDYETDPEHDLDATTSYYSD